MLVYWIPMKLRSGDIAPDFEVTSVDGESVRLFDRRGTKTLLCFYRYAQCAYCNYFLAETIRHQREYRTLGLSIIVFFQSPPEAVRDFPAKKNPDFPLIGDPAREVYGKYGVSSSALKAAWTYAHPGIVIETHKDGPKKRVIDGDPILIPAEFLIDEDGRIVTAHYASHFGDHITVTEILRFLTGEEIPRTT